MKINWKTAIIKGIGIAALLTGYFVDQYTESERINEAVHEHFEDLGLVKKEEEDADE